MDYNSPEDITNYLASLPEEMWESLWHQVHGLTVRNGPLNYDTFLAFMEMMTYDPLTGEVLVPAKHHEKWIKAAFAHDRVLILAPPESAKTTVMGVLFTLFWIGRHPASQSMIVSVSDDQATKTASLIASFITHHPAWKAAFPDIRPDTIRGWGDHGYFVKRGDDDAAWVRERGARTGATLVGVGYGNHSIIGRRIDGIMLVDDIMGEDNARSDSELEYTRDVFTKTISSRPTETAKMVVIGTPWRDDDVYASAEATGLYATFITPAISEDGEGNRVSYWPEARPVDLLDKKRKEVGEKAFQLMFQMNREAAKGQVLPESLLHPMFRAEDIDPRWPMVYGVDVAITSSDFGLKRQHGARSYFALSKIMITPWGLLVVDGIRAQVTLGEAIELIKTHAAVDRPRKVQVETWGSGELLLQQMVRETGLVVTGYKDSKDKTTRFVALSRHFEARRVRVSNAETPFLRAFRDEWVRYPAGTNDTLDAVTNGVAAAGVQVYDGDAVMSTNGPKLPKEPWGGSWGMPAGRFRFQRRRSN